jgi:drug/metabolite transporter (DMT)-like permease
VNKWLIYWSLAFVYGSVHLFIAIAVEQLTPFELVFSRTLLASTALNAFILVRGKRYPTDPRTIGYILLLGFLNIALPLSLVSWAQQTITSGITSVLNALTPLFALLFAHFAFSDERITPLKGSGIVIGFVGVVVLTSRNIDPTHFLSDDLLAELAIVASTVCFALGIIISRRVIKRGVDTIVLTSGVLTSAMVFIGIMTYLIAPVTLDIHPTPFTDWLPQTILSVLVLTAVHTILSHTLNFVVIKEFGVVRTSALAYLAPPISLTLGVVFRGETVDLLMIVGAIIILTGVIIANAQALREVWRSANPIPMQSPLVQPMFVEQRSGNLARRIRAQFRGMR